MGTSQYILSIDLGTGGPKVALVGDDGEIAAATARAVQTHRIPPAGAEQDPEEIWGAVRSAAKQVVHEAGKPPEAILGVICASQYFSVVPIDATGRALGNVILWMDGRGGPQALGIYQAHPEALGKWLEIHGMPPLPSGNDSLSHMLFLKAERPELYERTSKFVEPMDFVAARLTGTCVSNPCTVFALLLTDNRSPDAVDYSPELVAMSGIDREKLPELVPAGSCIGPMRKDVAAELGLAPGTKVFSGMNDTQAISIGAGTHLGRHGGINIGTTSQVLAFVEAKRTDAENEILSMPSPIPGRYVALAENGIAGKALEHFLHTVVYARDPLGDHSTPDAFAQLEKALHDAPPGSGGLLFLPWLTGSQSPSANAKVRGGFLNLSLETTRTRMVRAVLEGVSFNLRWLLGAVEGFAERSFDELRFSGGAATSDAWAQVLADVMDRPVLQLADARQASNRASAFLAFEQLGLVGLGDGEKICRIKRAYRPQAENRAVYDRLFEQFLAAYRQNLPVFEALNA